MTREEMIERMATAYFGTTGTVFCDVDKMFQPLKWEDLDPPDYQCVRAGYRDGCTASLEALCEAIPGLSDVIDGKAVIVPVEPTVEMLGAFWRQKNTGTQEIGTERADHRDDFSAYTAMINARPK